MKNSLLSAALFFAAFAHHASAISPPANPISLAGDQSVILHWDRSTDPTLANYRVYRSTTGGAGPFTLVGSPAASDPGYCDITSKAVNGQTNFYYVTAVANNSSESAPSDLISATPRVLVSDDAFLDFVEHASFFYFWYGANPSNGLVPDRSASGSPCSIAAVGFGLTALGIAADRGWITRTQAVARVLTTLNTFWQGPQGAGTSGTIGYQGWFYHFLDMNTAQRSPNSELSSIDTLWLLAGVLYAKQYFNGSGEDETSIRFLADAIFNRVNWSFMTQGGGVASGWQPATGFAGFSTYVGYNETMLLYLLGIGAATNPLPASAWNVWLGGCTWSTNYGQAYVPFPPLFGYEYSHCWADFRHVADPFMNAHSCTWFENSRRATLAQITYAIANPNSEAGYSVTNWGLTASDGPTGYGVHGIPPQGADDGTIAPTAAASAIPFAPEYVLPTLRNFYRFRIHIWTEYGFRDAFNLTKGWYDTDELGIDQGPIVLMIENHRSERVWQLFMQNAEIQRGLQRAGFVPLPFMPLKIEPDPAQGGFELSWNAAAGRFYQVEYSPQLSTWGEAPGFIQATNSGAFMWLDSGPPATESSPALNSQRFYRVYQLGGP